MKKYKCYIPRFEVEVKARSHEEAYNKAREIYEDWKDQDPEFGEIITELK